MVQDTPASAHSQTVPALLVAGTVLGLSFPVLQRGRIH